MPRRFQPISVLAEKSSSNVLEAGWDYGYDLAGNMSSVQTVTAPGQPALVTRRGHNALNQITSWGGPGKTMVRGSIDEPGQVAIGAGGGGLKPARMLEGNRFEAELNLPAGPQALRVSATDPSGNTSNYAYHIQVAHAGARSFAHDTNGNLLSDGIRSYEWDSLSRLKKVTWDATKTTEFKYNALGQRCERIDKTGTTTTAHHYYLFDGIDLVNRYTSGTAAGNIDRRYVNQGEQRKNGAAWDGYHYTRDHLGSVREVLRSDSTLVARYDYDPYGKRSTQYEASGYACDLGYTGHITQPSPVNGQTELVMTLFRAYDPELGRWLSMDPLGEAAGVNAYAYCFGNPLAFHDPDGLFPSAAWWGGFFDFDQGTVDALGVGAMATIDGALPFIDPFQDSGGYDPCQDGVGFSKAAGGVARDAGLAALTGGAAFARGGASRVIAGQAKSGIYQFGTKSGQYVGQSGNIAKRIFQHGTRRTGGVKQWAVRGGKTAREIAEQARIDKLGGIQNLANKVNPLGASRKALGHGYVTADAAAGLGGVTGGAIHAGDAVSGGDCN